jgi:hypothetical protein
LGIFPISVHQVAYLVDVGFSEARAGNRLERGYRDVHVAT